VSPMTREISAGGVVIRQISGTWHVALIEPQKENSQPAKASDKSARAVFALPKGLLDAGEKAEVAAIREVFEETGVRAKTITKLADIKYVYTRTWQNNERVFKIVSFFLMHYVSGEINDLVPEMRVEVNRALWLPLSEAPSQMAHSSDRKLLRQAHDYLQAHPLIFQGESS
jgi:8-oxo-dGTP pyrophosphatase MutT (NUDIX family)